MFCYWELESRHDMISRRYNKSFELMTEQLYVNHNMMRCHVDRPVLLLFAVP